ncbi:hypothetical protein AB0F11_36325 [Streptomyces sp. NPDC032472]|uniref:hypothetical protein n=1 Tax=Streptomyces sp. NPDC032472 TaxID=3155018 RepID=UPI0033F162C3
MRGPRPRPRRLVPHARRLLRRPDRTGLDAEGHLARDSPSGTPTLSVRWSDNQISLWPGESVTVKATHRTPDPPGTPRIRVSGWNARAVTVPSG